MTAARGTFLLLAAEAAFVASGWVIHVGSKRVLGLELYGVFGILLSLLTNYRIFLATGVNRAVARYIAETPDRARAVRDAALRIQLFLGLALGAAVWFLAPILSRFWHDPALAGYIRLSAFFLPLFGLYSVFRGVLNGFRLFSREAAVSMIYSLLKVALLFALIFSLKVYGAIGGYLGAVACATVLAGFLAPAPDGSGGPFPAGKLVAFAAPVVLFSFTVSLIQHADLYFVRALAPDPGPAAGYYTCAQQFARIPYMLLYALSLTLFPTIAARSRDREAVRRTLRTWVRWGLILSLPAAALIGAAADGLAAWVYGTDSLPAGAPLRVLVFGQTALAFLFLLASALAADGAPWTAFILVGGTLAADTALCALLVPARGTLGAAAATALACAGGRGAAWAAAGRRLGNPAGWATARRTLLAAAVAGGGAAAIAPRGWLLLVVLPALGGAAAAVLAATGEVDRKDLAMLASLFVRGKKPAAQPEVFP
ncbi:MAG TPA: oligosaccharide flippase family protein [bacterium]|nr:oligosaccharide flippase family protein [bacterium]